MLGGGLAAPAVPPAVPVPLLLPGDPLLLAPRAAKLVPSRSLPPTP